MRAIPSTFCHLRSALFAGIAFCALSGIAAAQSPVSPLKSEITKSEFNLKGGITVLAASPAHVTLRGPYSGARMLIDASDRAGAPHDVSGKTAFSIADPKIAEVDAEGTVRPRHDGATTLIARYQDHQAQVAISVSGVAQAGPPKFVNDVIPILTRAGCNQGACHGAASGKGGFKISLLGYDPASDYDAITRASRARRVSTAQPDSSLLLLKPTLGVAHRGGKRLSFGAADYRVLRAWIAAGMPGPVAKEPHVIRLEVTPTVRTLAVGQTQRFIVRAHYSDNSVRDATDETLFTASDETVAAVTPNGEAKATGPGEGAVVIRYQGLVAIGRVISPFGPPKIASKKNVGMRSSRPTGVGDPISLASATIDHLVGQKLDALGLAPSGNCSDSDFMRRSYLDMIGIPPTVAEARAFLADRDSHKRAKLIDTLLQRPEYVDFWTLQWADILRDSRDSLSEKGMYAFNLWIRQSVEENRPWDQFARQLLLAQGSVYRDGAANYYRTGKTPMELAENTAQVFLGVRIQCARCHNHPYDRWTQQQYYQMAAFFARVASKPGERTGEQVIFSGDKGEVQNPRTRKTAQPCALDATPLPATFDGDRRQPLADWLTSPQNPFFARVIVNRIWKHFMGRGFVEPVDDLRPTNPPSNAPLFDFLSTDFSRHGYDLQYLMRAIMRSRAYQRSPEPTGNNARDGRYQSHYAFKRLSAEQLLDAISAITGVSEKFKNLPEGTRAAQLPDAGVPSYFLDLFGRPARVTSCDCERSDDPNLGQLLHLMNSVGINSRLSAKTGRIATLLQSKAPNRQVVEDLYLASLSRFPTPAESQRALAIFTTAKDRQQAGEDLLWALLNSKEFLFNH